MMTKRRLAMEKLLTVEPKEKTPSEPRVRAVAVRSMGLSLERLHESGSDKADRVVELDTALCEPSFVRDRLDEAPTGDGEGDPVGIVALAQSIAQGGQAVPILVRPMPGREGRYQIAYGHRRWQACKQLGRPVRAIVQALGDEELVIAQGRENNERRDLSFIERAHFAAALVGKGLSRAIVCRALGIDKSELARLLAVANGLPQGLAAMIGRAPKAGRPRWMALAKLCEGRGGKQALAVAQASRNLDTDARFKAVYNALHQASPRPDRKRSARDDNFPAHVETRNGDTIIAIEGAGAASFGAFVSGQLQALYESYRAQSGTEPASSSRGRSNKGNRRHR